MRENMLTAIVGINWGDEGKGRMVDMLSEKYKTIVRYQGGNNAGHTVINERGKFILNLLPSGVLRNDAQNIMGPGMVVDIEHLTGELNSLKEKNIAPNLKISDKAVICLPYHKLLDAYEEDRLAGAKFGSTRRGIGPVYGDKYMKKVIKMGDLLYASDLKNTVYNLVQWKNLTVAGYKKNLINPEEIYQWVLKFGNPLKKYICDVSRLLAEADDVLFEAQLGALRDIDYGIFPYTSSSSVIAAYAPIGAGIPNRKLDKTIGVMKAYSSAVGEGPFTCELFGAEAERLRDEGGEYGAATGRPRRVGYFDAVASRYGALVQGADEIALTKLDVLSFMDEIPICAAYEIDGVKTRDFITDERLARAKPVYEYIEGFKTDISNCTGRLPEKALIYVKRLEELVGVKIKYVSVGPERSQYVTL
jgi:adenylosuccinate synthase